tara:strand:- start:94 stop:225 length:132 start_codon:yes stop_codon:yes gene_type:complete
LEKTQEERWPKWSYSVCAAFFLSAGALVRYERKMRLTFVFCFI